MKIKQQHEKIEKPEGILISIFKMCEVNNLNNTPYQFNYYKDKKTTTYENGKIILENAETFNKEEPEKLNIDKIKYEYEELNTEVLKEYNENITKVIILIQKDLYNLSYITSSMNIINIKIDQDNKVLEHSKKSILSFKGD